MSSGFTARRRRGRPFKGPSDELREGVLRQVVAMLPCHPAECASHIREVLRGDPVTDKRIERIAKHCPEVREAMRWPLRLLDPRLRDRKSIAALASTFDSSEGAWPFGDRVLELPDPHGDSPLRYRADACWLLMDRRDIYGFLALLCLFQQSHIDRDIDAQYKAARCLARSVVGAALHPAFTPHAGLLVNLTNRMLAQLPYCCVPVEIDVSICTRMIQAKKPYIESGLLDPLIQHRLVRTAGPRASLLLPGLIQDLTDRER